MQEIALQEHEQEAAKAQLQSHSQPQTSDLEECHEQYKKVAEQAKARYAEVYRQMVQKLSTSHLDPFVEILLEQNDFAIENNEHLAEALRNKVLERLVDNLDYFWSNSNVSDSLASLEMLKDKCKDFKGKDWNMQNKLPAERALPIRIYFKETRKRYLQKQLQFQSTQLSQTFEENRTHRSRIHQITEQRTYLWETMKASKKDFPQLLQQLSNMEQKLLDLELDQSKGDKNEGDTVALVIAGAGDVA